MKKYICIGIFFLVFLIPFGVDASPQGSLNEEVWYLDTEVMLNGSDLTGPVPSQSKLCFAPEALKDDIICFKNGHPNISKWTEGNITFVPPKNTPPSGVVVLVHPYWKEACAQIYNDFSCDSYLEKEKTVIASYKAHPYISALIDRETGSPPEQLEAGKEYEIIGYRFGSNGVGIFIGDRFQKMIPKPDILRWTHDSIVFQPSQTYDAGQKVRVHNGAGKGNDWVIGVSESPFAEDTDATESNEDAAVQAVEVSDETAATDQLLVERSAYLASLIDLITNSPFSDVAVDDPYYPAIVWSYATETVQGYEDGTFGPDLPVNRAEFLKIVLESNGNDVAEATGSASFLDVQGDEWFAPYVEYAKQSGYIEGYEDDTFRPNRAVTLAEALKMIYEIYVIETQPVDQEEAQWYTRYLLHALAFDILFDPDADPAAPLARKDVVWIVWKLSEFNKPSL